MFASERMKEVIDCSDRAFIRSDRFGAKRLIPDFQELLRRCHVQVPRLQTFTARDRNDLQIRRGLQQVRQEKFAGGVQVLNEHDGELCVASQCFEKLFESVQASCGCSDTHDQRAG